MALTTLASENDFTSIVLHGMLAFGIACPSCLACVILAVFPIAIVLGRAQLLLTCGRPC